MNANQMKLNLPFDYDVIGLMKSGTNRHFVTVTRNHPVHAFVTYEIGVDGACVQGDYCSTRSEAFRSLYERATNTRIDRPGDAAAIFAEEAGCSYSEALVACNMD